MCQSTSLLIPRIGLVAVVVVCITGAAAARETSRRSSELSDGSAGLVPRTMAQTQKLVASDGLQFHCAEGQGFRRQKANKKKRGPAYAKSPLAHTPLELRNIAANFFGNSFDLQATSRS